MFGLLRSLYGRLLLLFGEPARHGTARTRLLGLRTYGVALIFGFIGFTIIVNSHPVGVPTDGKKAAVALIVALFGSSLLAIVIYDAYRKSNAKRKLGHLLAQLGPDELAYLREAVSSPTFGTFLGDFPSERQPRLIGWQNLLTFLNYEPLGATASRALFQPSLIGRLRYLDSAIWLGARIRYQL
jgi:hypothetical protein